MSIHQQFFTLRNGIEMPAIGFGTWLIPQGPDAYNAVRSAVDLGYRHIDTAQAYENEESVGRAVRDSGIARSELFVTTKLPAEIKDVDKAAASFEETMELIGLDYLDLYLIHAPWPWNDIGRDCAEPTNRSGRCSRTCLPPDGCVRSAYRILPATTWTRLAKRQKIEPMVNQISFSVGRNQDDTIASCRARGIVLQGYSPLGHGGLADQPRLAAIAARYGRSAAQLCIRYVLQKGLAPLPKTVNPGRMRENADITFTISDEDMAVLDSFN